eukprot:SAG22_NODE_852_length_6847_cov_14.600830_1_plen_342_part_10
MLARLALGGWSASAVGLVAGGAQLQPATAQQWSSPVVLAPCDPSDPQQQWLVDSGREHPVQLVADGRCLQSAACATAELTKAVVDSCSSPCAASGWTWSDDAASAGGVIKYGTGQNLCLDTDASEASADAFVQVYHCKPASETPGYANQEFRRHPDAMALLLEVKASPGPAGTGIKQCPRPPCCLSAAKAPAGCFSSGPCRSTSGWGWTLTLLVAGGAALYVAGGVVYTVKVGGQPVPRLSPAAVLKAHPHISRWTEVAALVRDGVTYTRALVTGTATSASPSPGEHRERGGGPAAAGHRGTDKQKKKEKAGKKKEKKERRAPGSDLDSEKEPGGAGGGSGS